jgi:hypothetical protein
MKQARDRYHRRQQLQHEQKEQGKYKNESFII